MQNVMAVAMGVVAAIALFWPKSPPHVENFQKK
jgi:hypothetical protein